MEERKPKISNARIALSLLAIVVGMVALAYASVPLYRLFCQVTGIAGTTQIAEEAPEAVSGRIVTVRFNADIDPALSWDFRPQQKAIDVRIGERSLAFFEAVNSTDGPLTGTSTFNVTPLKAGQYFNKIACFCFEEQRLDPGERADLPVSFFIDPAFLNDPNMEDVSTITLSYTFFRVKTVEDN